MAIPTTKPFEIAMHHGGISVPDLEASVAWYGEMLGCGVEARFTIPVIPAEVVMLKRGNVRLELFQVPGSVPAAEDRREPARDVRTQGTKHICLAVKDVHAAAEELRRRDADIVFVQDFDFDGYKGSTMFVRDRAGTLVELIQQPDLFG